MSAKEGKTVGIFNFFKNNFLHKKSVPFFFMGGGKKQRVGSEGGGKVACGSND